MPTVDELRVHAQKVIFRCRKLSTFSEQAGRTTRTFLSPPMHDCHREIASWMEPLKADMRIDPAGNFRAYYPGSDPHAPRLLIGSHLDSVPSAGAFDGVLGVVIGAALLETLHPARLPFGIELVGFSEEEGVRFRTPFIGSRALMGKLDDDLLARQDERRISMREAIKNFGLNPDDIRHARVDDDILGYIEFHIEQGPVLEGLGLPLGIVEAIAGQTKMDITFVGRANHAGTTPMDSRRDAIAGAAEWILAVEREARGMPDLVATVGALRATPGVSNVVAGESFLTLDVRHPNDDVRVSTAEKLGRLAEGIAARRRLTVRCATTLNQPAVGMNAVLVSQVEEAVRQADCQPHRMVSGAGHDAMILAERFPTAMVFLRTPGGISHSPEENVHVEDVEKALAAGVNLLALLASSVPTKRGS